MWLLGELAMQAVIESKHGSHGIFAVASHCRGVEYTTLIGSNDFPASVPITPAAQLVPSPWDENQCIGQR